MNLTNGLADALLCKSQIEIVDFDTRDFLDELSSVFGPVNALIFEGQFERVDFDALDLVDSELTFVNAAARIAHRTGQSDETRDIAGQIFGVDHAKARIVVTIVAVLVGFGFVGSEKRGLNFAGLLVGFTHLQAVNDEPHGMTEQRFVVVFLDLNPHPFAVVAAQQQKARVPLLVALLSHAPLGFAPAHVDVVINVGHAAQRHADFAARPAMTFEVARKQMLGHHAAIVVGEAGVERMALGGFVYAFAVVDANARQSATAHARQGRTVAEATVLAHHDVGIVFIVVGLQATFATLLTKLSAASSTIVGRVIFHS